MTALDPRALEAAHKAMDAAYSIDAMLTCPDCKSGVVVVDYGEGPGGDVCPRCGGAGIVTPPDWNPLSTAISTYLASLPPAPAGSVGEPEMDLWPDDPAPIADKAVDHVFRELAQALGLETWSAQDGSETWEGDVYATMMHILYDAGVIDPETNERALAAAPPVQEPVAWVARGYLDQLLKGQNPTAVLWHDAMEASHVPLYASPPPLPAQEAGWQPIETAPKDGTWVQLWRGPVTSFGTWAPLVYARWWRFDDGEEAWAWPDDVFDPWHDIGGATAALERGDCYDTVKGFTHWRPLPAPPRPQDTKP